MIIVLKGRNPKRIIVKIASVFSLVIMFGLYYQHMSDKFSKLNGNIANSINVKEQKKQLSKSVKLENIIYKEAIIISKLLSQKNIKYIKVVKNRLLISCDYDTKIDPLLVRYGVNAMIKKSNKDIKIAIEIAIIVENKYEV